MLTAVRKWWLEKRIRNMEGLLASPVLRGDTDTLLMIRQELRKARERLGKLTAPEGR